MDEMDLMKNLREVPAPSSEAYDRARAALHTAMTEPVTTVVTPRRWFKVGIAAIGAAAVVMGTTGGTVPAGTSEAAPPAVVESPLVKLASDVKAAAQPVTRRW